jgi:hypothetical protein
MCITHLENEFYVRLIPILFIDKNLFILEGIDPVKISIAAL